MRLSSKTLSFLLNFLLGSAWAFTIVGVVAALMHNASYGWLYALANALLWAIPGVFSLVILEYLLHGFERNEEMRRQTEILSEIRDRLSPSSK